MTANEYQREALKTESKAWMEADDDENGLRLLQGLMGLCGESGEAIDILKKTIFQGHELDREHLAKELGDVAWYLALSADVLGYSLDEIMQMNIEKLARRYPDGRFDAEKSVNRPREDV